ncbi:phosphatase PAP2 family protein [Streptomyces genisteinicus]|uniref:Phosphatase PAP2 family protein n=1 Tax=Streptomyces genisteinicus TaxID=2768068 RepID=A0A7H0I1D4_9ACTN|nr:phosphatase PAP2 family protein [Streptomyces genisteinicus]
MVGWRARAANTAPGEGGCAPRDARPPHPALLPPPHRSWLRTAAVAAALVVAALGLLYAGSGAPGTVDAWIASAVYAEEGSARSAALATDFLGEPVGAAVLVAAAVTVCLLRRRPRAAVLAVAGPGAAVAVTKLLKPLVGRTIHDGHLSYPSGHTAFLTALAVVVALLAAGRPGTGRGRGTALLAGAAVAAGAAMGWAQVALGAHYATDAAGGWCTALAVVPATAWLLDRMASAGRRGRA